MKQYLDALRHVLENGTTEDSRAGGVTRTFGYQMRFNLQDGFPAVTTKKLAWRAVVGELLWFLEGSGDERRLAEITHGESNGKVTIWTGNALAPYWKPKAKFTGDLGRVYGVQWRHWKKYTDMSQEQDQTRVVSVKEVDQIEQLLTGLREDPYSRRHILTAWNVSELDQMALPPCHAFAQFYVSNGKLSCQLYQRSADMFLGVPFNIASYSLLTHILAKEVGLDVGEFVHTIGDMHIYNEHIYAVNQQLERTPDTLPKLVIADNKNINNYTVDDFILENYNPQESIKAKMNV
jgi:thymidylate synthase